MSGKNHYAWTGDKASYSALHMWLHLHLGSAKKCETCGLKQRKNGKKSYFHWANISHTYKRDLKDWKQLCVKCHYKYDYYEGRMAKRWKPVRQLYRGKIIAKFRSIKEAAEKTGFERSRISEVCNGRRKMYSNCSFEFIKTNA